MHSWHDVKISRVTPSDFLAVIEISKGTHLRPCSFH